MRLWAVVALGVLAGAGCRAAGAGSGPAEPWPVTPVAGLQAELRDIFADPAFENAHWGVMIQSLETGEIMFRHNSRKLFMPASNNKLVTAAVALSRLRPDYRFRTRVAARGAVGPDGTLQGDLVIIGGGDPAISERFFDDDPTAPFRAWADSLGARGIRRIDGDLVGDDDLYDDVHIGPGWAWDYLDAYYAAEIGALLYNEGAVTYRIAPGDSVGAAARVDTLPPTRYLELEIAVKTVADSTGNRVRAERAPFSNRGRIWGEIWVGGDTVTRYLAPHDPTRFFLTALEEVLEAEGIEITGVVVDADDETAGRTTDAVAAGSGDRSTPPSGDSATTLPSDSLTTLFVFESPTLASIIEPFLKRSQNQIGEMLLRHLGVATVDTGSVAAGRRAVQATLSDWGIPESLYIYVDGSGLSRYNYQSPESLVRLLRVMARRPEFEIFYEALPIAGVDGTLRNRMRGSRAEGNVRAKTGSISNSRALSGYVTTLDGERLIFSMIANNFDVPADMAEYVQDLALERLANFSRR